MVMINVFYACRAAAVLTMAVLISAPAWGLQREDGAGRESGDRKPSLSLRATPPVGFTPLRVHLAAELRGGADDFADLYCPTYEWDWGDGTKSENTEDCQPYEAGKSQIRRRIGVYHTYREPGGFKVSLRLKQRTRVISSSSVVVQVRAGAGQGE
jgi:hypothetical protein